MQKYIKAPREEIENIPLQETRHHTPRKIEDSDETSNKKIFGISSLLCQYIIFLTIASALTFSGSISVILIHSNISIISNDYKSDNLSLLFDVIPNRKFSSKSESSETRHGSGNASIPAEIPKSSKAITPKPNVSNFTFNSIVEFIKLGGRANSLYSWITLQTIYFHRNQRLGIKLLSQK